MVALLHDIVDDTPTSIAAVEAAFGPAVAAMVTQVFATFSMPSGGGYAPAFTRFYC